MDELSFFGTGAQFEHIGLVVPDIATAHPCSTPTVDPLQKVAVDVVSIHGITVELIEPMSVDSPVSAALMNNQKLVHLCFTVPDLRAAISTSRPHGFHLIARPVPAAAFAGREIAWVYSKIFGLVELLEMHDGT